MQVPLSQSLYAVALEQEGTFGDKARRAWEQARVEWQKFGEREFPTSRGFSVRFNDLPLYEARLAEVDLKLKELTPGIRERLAAERRAALPDDERRALDTPPDARTVTESRLAFEAERRVKVTDPEVAAAADSKVRPEAERLAAEVVVLREKVIATKAERHTFNYDYWTARAEMEATDEALQARELFYRAMKESDEKPWAARTTFEEGFQRWRKILDQYPDMLDDTTAFEVYDLTKAYRRVLGQLDVPFDKSKFILRDLLEKNEGM
jgi:hypothetical protein